MYFIKRHDLRPYLEAQLFLSDGGTEMNLGDAVIVYMIVRPAGAGLDDDPKFKKPCNVLSASLGLLEYHWSGSDTDTAGVFEYEFEIVWPDSEPQTIPADGYLSLIIGDDIG